MRASTVANEVLFSRP